MKSVPRTEQYYFSRQEEPRAWSVAATVCVFGICYLACAELGHFLSFKSIHTATFWPANGLYLGVLLLSPRGRRREFVAGAVLANLISNQLIHGQGPLASICFTLVNSLETILAALVVRYWLGPEARFDSLRSLLIVLGGGALLAPLGGALLGGLIAQQLLGSPFWQAVVGWWTGDVLGIILVTPLVLFWASGLPIHRGENRTLATLEGVLLFSSLALVTQLVFSASGEMFSSPFPIIPFLVWAALRFGPTGIALACLMHALIALGLGSRGIGPQMVAGTPPYLQLLALQASLGFTTVAFLVLGVVVAERREKEGELARTLRLVNGLFENAPVAMQIFDPFGQPLRMNQAYRQLLGLTDSTPDKQMIPPDTDPLAHMSGIADCYKRIHLGEAVSIPGRSIRVPVRQSNGGKGERRAWFDQLIFPLRDTVGRIEAIVSFSRDITERRAAEEALREMQRLNQRMLDLSPCVIYAHDLQQQKILYLNQAGASVINLKPSEVQGRDLDLLRPFFRPEDFARILASSRRLEALPDGGVVEVEYEMQGADGVRRLYHDRMTLLSRTEEGKVKHILGVAIEITEQRAAEKRLRHLEKLESLGILAGGLAHDFNNLLTPILGYASLAQNSLDPESPLRPMMEQIERSAIHAADLVKQILAYAGKELFGTSPVDLSSLVNESQTLGQHFGLNQHLHLELAPQLPLIEADTVQIERVLTNLVSNAVEALEGNAGNVTIRTGSTELTLDFLREADPTRDLKPGPYVYLEVEDDGSGMTNEVRSRIFDPFFSTRFIGRGLGLAAVQGTVRSHGGLIVVDSQPGRGSRFRVLFPVPFTPEA